MARTLQIPEQKDARWHEFSLDVGTKEQPMSASTPMTFPADLASLIAVYGEEYVYWACFKTEAIKTQGPARRQLRGNGTTRRSQGKYIAQLNAK
jgi:hypothetical protein